MTNELIQSPHDIAPRREFLHGARNLGMLGAALHWFGHVPAAAAPATQTAAAVTAVDTGYRETDHIRKYYAAARYF